MPKPWVLDDNGIPVQQRTEFPRITPGDWSAVEDYLGLKLPADDKDLIGEGVTLEFDHELLIYSPFDRRPAVELFAHVANASHAEALLRTFHPELHVDAVFPEPLGSLAWGSDGGGAVYH